MRINRRTIKSIIVWLLMFGIIYSSSMVVFETFSGFIRLSILLVLSITLFLIGRKKFNTKIVLIYFSFLLLIGISITINGTVIALDLGSMAAITSAMLIITTLSKEEYIESFTSIMMFLAICSLVTYILFIVAPSVVYRFPIHTWRMGRTQFANMFLAAVPVSMNDYYRNFGIFYEPGIYQIFINIALLFELFYRNTNVKRVIVWVMTIITTLSTNGVISCGILLFAYGLKLVGRTSDKQAKKRRLRFLVLGTALVFCFIYFYGTGVIDNRLFNKFTTTRTSGTIFDRLNAITYALDKFFSDPIFGVGHTHLQDAYNITFTPLNWFMFYGFLFGLAANVFYCKFVHDLNEKKGIKIVLSVFLLSILTSQNVAREWFVWCIVFYGSYQV